MIGIRVNDDNLDVPKGVRVTLQLNNPVLGEETLSPGSVSLPFDLPGEDNSPLNAAILGNPDVLENSNMVKKIPATLLVDQVPYRKGNLLVRQSSPGKINTNFNFGLSSISNDIRTVKLRDILNDQIVIDNSNLPKKIYLKLGGAASSPYRIQVNGQVFENTSLANLVSDINASTEEPRATATHITVGSTPGGMAAPYIELTPFTNPNDPLSPLHVDVVEDNGNSLSGFKWLVEADLGNYSTVFQTFYDGYNTSTYATEKFRLPFMFNDNLYGENVVNFAGTFLGGTKQTNYINGCNGFGLLINDPNFGVGVNVPFAIRNTNTLQPFVRMRWVLDKIAEYLGVQYEGDWIDSDVNNMLIDNAQPLDVPLDFIGKTKFVFWKRSFNLADLVEDITVVEFFTRLKFRYNLGIYLNETTGRIRIVKREPIALQVSDKDITAQCGQITNRDDVRLTGVKLFTPKTDDDTLTQDDEYILGEPEQVFEVKLGGLQENYTITSVLGLAATVTGPRKIQKVTDKFSFRVFYYKGITDNGVFTYPEGSINALNYAEKFSGSTGLYNTRWKYWLHFLTRRRIVSLPTDFSFSEIKAINWEELVRLDRKQFIIKSINVTIEDREHISVSSVQLATMF